MRSTYILGYPITSFSNLTAAQFTSLFQSQIIHPMVRLYPFLILNPYKESHQAAEPHPIKPLHLTVKLFCSLTIESVND